jgi:hypothetical protein
MTLLQQGQQRQLLQDPASGTGQALAHPCRRFSGRIDQQHRIIRLQRQRSDAAADASAEDGDLSLQG